MKSNVTVTTPHIFGLLVQYAPLLIVLFLVLVGAVCGTFLNFTAAAMPPGERYALQLLGWLGVSLLMTALTHAYPGWGWVVHSLIGLFAGAGSIKLALWPIKIIRESDTIPEFVARLLKVYRAVNDPLNQKDDTDDQPKT